MEALPGDAFNQQALRLTAGHLLHLLMAFPLLQQATGGQQQAAGLIRVAEAAVLLQVFGQVGVVAGPQGNGFGFLASRIPPNPRIAGFATGITSAWKLRTHSQDLTLCPRSH